MFEGYHRANNADKTTFLLKQMKMDGMCFVFFLAIGLYITQTVESRTLSFEMSVRELCSGRLRFDSTQYYLYTNIRALRCCPNEKDIQTHDGGLLQQEELLLGDTIGSYA